MRRWLEEPLVHFVVLGTLMFVLYGRFAASSQQERAISIDAGQVQGFAAGFAALHGRAPDAAELQGLVEAAVREEVLYRQALALGLDRGDTLVRQRLVQKLEFLMEDIADAVLPTDAELEAFLREDPERYRAPPRIAFRDVFVRAEWHGPDAAPMAQGLLAHLRRGVEAAEERALGDARVVEPPSEPLGLPAIAARFGAPFAERLAALAPEEWAGPLESEVGLHLVRVTARVPGSLPGLEEVRARVEADWRGARRRQSAERKYRELLERQTVRIDWPAPQASTP